MWGFQGGVGVPETCEDAKEVGVPGRYGDLREMWGLQGDTGWAQGHGGSQGHVRAPGMWGVPGTCAGSGGVECLWTLPHCSLPSLHQLSWCTGRSGTRPGAPPKRCTHCCTAWRCSLRSLVGAVGGGNEWGPHPSADGLLSAGLVAVFESHRDKGIANMYSLHSWCGMAAFVLYLLQVSARSPRRDVGWLPVGLSTL